MEIRKTLIAKGIICTLMFSAANSSASQSAGFETLAEKCAPDVSTKTLAALVSTESSFNPFAIGVVGGRLERQPTNKETAIATAHALDKAGVKYSAGIAQVFRGNWENLGLTHESVFDVCPNLKAGSSILKNCYLRAKKEEADSQEALQMAFSCYYSNNFTTGFKSGPAGAPSYVQKIMLSAANENEVVPAIKFIPDDSASTPPTAPKKEPVKIRRAKPTPAEIVDYENLPSGKENGKTANESEKTGGTESPYVFDARDGEENEENSVSVF